MAGFGAGLSGNFGQPGNTETAHHRGRQCRAVYRGREERMNPWKEAYAADTEARTLAEALVGADIFLGIVRTGCAQAGNA